MSPAAVVHTSSSGGTHAGLVAGRALLRSLGHDELPEVLAIGVAKGVVAGHPDVRDLAARRWRCSASDVEVGDDDVEIDTRWLGPDYGVPTPAGDEAIRWAAVHGGWVLDRTYTGKGFAGLLGNAATGRWRSGRRGRLPPHRRSPGRVRRRRHTGVVGRARLGGESLRFETVATQTAPIARQNTLVG